LSFSSLFDSPFPPSSADPYGVGNVVNENPAIALFSRRGNPANHVHDSLNTQSPYRNIYLDLVSTSNPINAALRAVFYLLKPLMRSRGTLEKAKYKNAEVTADI
jgi:hypothetical protein